MNTYVFTADLWRWTGQAAWHFVTLPHEMTDDIDESHEESGAGFGSRRVEVTVGDTIWRTSLFPDKTRASYVLPIKQAVRTKELLVDGDPVEVHIRLVVD